MLDHRDRILVRVPLRSVVASCRRLAQSCPGRSGVRNGEEMGARVDEEGILLDDASAP